MDVKIPKIYLDEIDPIIALVYITLLIPLICTLLFAI